LISAVVLAAGSSSRMRGPKQLLKLGQTTILGRVVKTFNDSKVDEVVVVLGGNPRLEKGIQLKGARVILNRKSSSGLSSSIKAGLEAVDSSSEAVLFGLGDKPFVKAETVNRIIESYLSSGSGIVVPVYRGRRGNPVLFAREFFKELGSISGDVGGKTVIRKHRDRVLKVDVEDEGILSDIDTLSDFEKARARLNQSKRLSPT
jgi:molybdenum cofactor cytidylyltransferase